MSQDISPEVLQREWVEATQEAIRSESNRDRAATELRNAEAQYESARAKADGLEQAWNDARGVSATPAVVPAPKPAAPAAKQAAAPAPPTADDLAI